MYGRSELRFGERIAWFLQRHGLFRNQLRLRLQKTVLRQRQLVSVLGEHCRTALVDGVLRRHSNVRRETHLRRLRTHARTVSGVRHSDWCVVVADFGRGARRGYYSRVRSRRSKTSASAGVCWPWHVGRQYSHVVDVRNNNIMFLIIVL